MDAAGNAMTSFTPLRSDTTDFACLTISRVAFETPEILVLNLVAPDASDLLPWSPGAHIDLVLPSGKIRQYSLCGDPADLTHYRLAVLLDKKGRGGSAEIHRNLSVGQTITTRGPRNHFDLVDASNYLFIAGGIGVTPFLPMIRAAERKNRPWRLIYGGRSRVAMGFVPELTTRCGGDLVFLPEDEYGLPDLDVLLSGVDNSTAIYGCGPSGMLAALESAAARHGLSNALHIERFTAAETTSEPRDGNHSFEVELRRSGLILNVPADTSLGSVLQDANVPVTFSCLEGYCGSCETRVLGGVPDHRDSILTNEEKEEGRIMMVCVGRACSQRLVLDL